MGRAVSDEIDGHQGLVALENIGPQFPFRILFFVILFGGNRVLPPKGHILN